MKMLSANTMAVKAKGLSIFIPAKPYKPAPHPMQSRIDEFRSIPSMWNGKEYRQK
jgi:hypothetical protein